MAHSKLSFTHPVFGTTKIAPVGYDWLCLVIGPLSPLVRGDFKWAFIVLVITFIVGAIIPIFGAFISWGVFGVIYNKLYIKDLLDKGYQLSYVESHLTVHQLQAALELNINNSQ